MVYQVLARKWRPRTFQEVVGQDHVVKALMNALTQGRLHHAYLFTGTRGVGKTTLARILAKALNCEQGVSGQPCLSCNVCEAIERGHFSDLIEIDAASRTKVEDTREILDNVPYAPTDGRYKVYLIDEVHMLSTHSFNALLKTLEEPPPHVKFLLATTERHKVPMTVLSRCLQFSLRLVVPEEIAAHLKRILEAEDIAFEEAALHLLAKAAKGSLRDALSLLDQAISYCGESIDLSQTTQMLAVASDGAVFDVLRAINANDGDKVLQLSRQLAQNGTDLLFFLDEVLEMLHLVNVRQCVPASKTNQEDEIADLSRQMSKADVQLFYQIALKGREDLPFAPTPLIGLEMTLLRMLCFQLSPSSSRIEPHPKKDKQVPANTQTREASEAISVESKPVDMVPPVAPEPSLAEQKWTDIVNGLDINGMAQTVLNHSELLKKDGARLTLGVEKGCQALLRDSICQQIEAVLSKHFGEKVSINVELLDKSDATPARIKAKAQQNALKDAKEKLNQDPGYLNIIEQFGGKVVDDSIQLRDAEL